MGLPPRVYFTVHEVTARWGCNIADVAGWAYTGRFRILTGIPAVRCGDEVVAGILAHTDESASRHRQLQPGREQRLYPEGGSTGAGHRESSAEPLADTGRAELEGVEPGQHHPHRW